LNMTVLGVSFRLVLLAFETLLDVVGNFLFHVWKHEVPLYEFDRFRDTRVPLHGVVVMLFDTVLFLVWSNNEFPLYYWEFFGIVLKNAQHISEVLDVSAKASVLVCLQDTVLYFLLSIHVVTTSAECICSSIIAPWGVSDFELILSEEFGPSNLPSYQLFSCREVREVLIV
jgi:hypothetical protein